jgi:hypothetical protein
MENLNLKDPLTPNGTQPPVIDLPASSVTALPVTASPVPPHTWSDVASRTMDGGVAAFGVLWKLFKLFVCVMLDLLDMVMVGWIGVSILFEVGSALICMALWGKRGLWGLAEMAEFTEFIDPWFPVCTLIALKSWND